MKNAFELGVSAAAMALLIGCVETAGAGGTTVGSAATSTTSSGSMMSTGGSANGGSANGGSANGGRGGEGGSPTGPGGMGGDDTCADQGIGEPNETMDNATLLAGGSDCVDPGDLGTAGTIDGPDDVDWYAYVQTADEAGCNVNPARDWSQQSGHTIRVCKYVACQNNDMSPDTVNCNDGSVADEQNGIRGCCGTSPFNVGIGLFGCDGGDDLLNVFTRVDEPDATADNCNTYNLNYIF